MKQSFSVSEAIRLDLFLAQQFPDSSRSKLSSWIKDGHVTVNGVVEKPGIKLQPGMTVEADIPEERPPQAIEPATMAIEILYQDEDVLVVNKPRGLITHPAPTTHEPTLVNALLGMQVSLSHGSEGFRPGIVHRLDKETTGVIMVAKNDRAHVWFAEQISSRSAGRVYLAVLSHPLPKPTITINSLIGRDPRNRQKMAVTERGKPATTHLISLEAAAAGTLVAAKLESGRTHQIRVHCSSAGFPVIGDPVYGGRIPECAMQLHAAMIEFNDLSGKRIQVTANPPSDFLVPFDSAKLADLNWKNR